MEIFTKNWALIHSSKHRKRGQRLRQLSVLPWLPCLLGRAAKGAFPGTLCRVTGAGRPSSRSATYIVVVRGEPDLLNIFYNSSMAASGCAAMRDNPIPRFLLFCLQCMHSNEWSAESTARKIHTSTLQVHSMPRAVLVSICGLQSPHQEFLFDMLEWSLDR